jgi:hypothetical protein
MFYSGNSYRLQSGQPLGIFEILTEDFGNLVPSFASYIGNLNDKEDTIIGTLSYSNISTGSIKIVADFSLTSVKLNSKDVSFDGAKDGNVLRTVRTDIKVGDTIEICVEKLNTSSASNNFAILAANVDYFDIDGNLQSISTDSSWTLLDDRLPSILADLENPIACLSEMIKVAKGISPTASILWDKHSREKLCVKKTLA